MTTVILTQPHTHAGVFHPIGSRLEVDDFLADWLMRYGIARSAPQPEAPKPAAKSADQSAAKPTVTTKE